MLHDQPVRFLQRKLRLRQVTRLGAHGHQTPIITSRWDLPAIVVAYRMFERWRQENFFKYIKAEYWIDALADYQIEPDDPHRSVPNPARKALEKEIRRTRSQLEKLRARYAEATLGSRSHPHPRPTKKETRALRSAIERVQARLKELQRQHHSLTPRLPLAEARQGEVAVKLATERKHLTNVLKMVAYNIESDLVQLIRPHYKRAEDEGRTFIQSALQDAADLEPTSDELHIRLVSSPQLPPSNPGTGVPMCSTERDQLHLPGHPTTNALFSGELVLKQQKADRFRPWYVRRSEITIPGPVTMAPPQLPLFTL